MAAAIAGFTVPSFVLALVLVLVFAVHLGWLPSGGNDRWIGAILPVLALGLGGAAVLARFSRSAMVEILGQPYIRTASAKGLLWRAVVRAHALPNAAIPLVTIVGLHDRRADGGRGGDRERVQLAGARPPDGDFRGRARPLGGAVHPGARLDDDGGRRTSPWTCSTAISTRACASLRKRR